MTRRIRSRKGAGTLEYSGAGLIIGLFLAGMIVRFISGLHLYHNEPHHFLSPVPEVKATQSAVPVQIVDDRSSKLERFFNSYNSPLATLSAAFVRYADDYQVDYRLVAAISGAESTFCKPGQYRPETNNCFGYGPHWPFASHEAAIKKVSWTIGQQPQYADWRDDRDNLSKLAVVYNTSDPEAWEVTVREFINEIN